MNHHQQVPVFEMDGEDYPTPANRPGKSIMSEDDDVMVLIWQHGKVVMLNQSQNRQTPQKYDVGLPEQNAPAAAAPESYQPPHIFMHEDEMATWLNYPLPENVFGSNFLYSDSNPLPSTAESAAATSVVMETTTVVGPGSSSRSKTDSRLDSTNASSFAAVSVSGFGGGGVLSATASEREVTCETTSVTSLTSFTSGGGSTTRASGSISAEAVWGPVDRKRKAKEPEDTECQGEEVEFESGSRAKKESRGGSSSIRRSRAAEVHNLSERKRRYRINEKMKSLQVMVPRCNKTDKASMLDEAIEYVKTLQSQVQVMSLGGCGMVPMMFPGVHPYMPMGLARMAMGVDMGMPIMPYGNVLAGAPMPTPAAAHMGLRLPVPAYQMPTMPPNDPNVAQATGHSDQTSISDSFGTDSQSQSLGPCSSDPYQQYPTSQQVQLQQNQAMAQPSFSKGPQNRESQQ